MKKYAILINSNPEVSRKVQEKLFELGFFWPCNGRSVNPPYNVLFLNSNTDYKISHSSDMYYLADKINKGYILLTPEYVFEYGETLDGASLPAKKPAKKMTVSEIAKELGYDVEVVKG